MAIDSRPQKTNEKPTVWRYDKKVQKKKKKENISRISIFLSFLKFNCRNSKILTNMKFTTLLCGKVQIYVNHDIFSFFFSSF